MTRRKDEYSAAALDREYPFQIALQADKCGGKNMVIFGGEPFNPADRGRGRSWAAWRKRS